MPLYIEVSDAIESAQKLNEDINRIHNWSQKWLVNFSPSKTKSLTIGTNKNRTGNADIFMNNTKIDNVPSHTYLGPGFSSDLKWNSHIHDICLKAEKKLNTIRQLKYN